MPATISTAHRQPPSGKAAFAREIREGEQPERDHHAQRHQAEQQPLHERDRHQVPEAGEDLHQASSILSSAMRKRSTSVSTLKRAFASPETSRRMRPASIISRRSP